MTNVKDNFFVLTGGPGGGKSTLLKEMHTMGFEFIDETARQIIKERIFRGMPPRPSPLEFAVQMFEKDLQNFTSNSIKTNVIFFDRSFLDSAALIYEADVSYFKRIEKIITTHRFNTKVFITPPWKEIYQTDNERDQSYQESVSVYEKLFDWYSLCGYQLKPLPKAPVHVRSNFILNEIKLA